MYFRGAWKQPFLKVEPAMFYTANSEKKQVQTMWRSHAADGWFARGAARRHPGQLARGGAAGVAAHILRGDHYKTSCSLSQVRSEQHLQSRRRAVGCFFSGGTLRAGAVQHVAVRVDNADTSASQLAASNAVQESLKNIPLSSIKEPRRFSVDRPFMFFIIDRLDNLVVIAGKVIDPEAPTPVEI
ncbi:uncharacterized protein LOC133518456 [Cydia pomonella]|uniref:uncharacterized protein LOC133518456 n=1 Tax=Cydia pomonella TaxID=82600 RepID=UPI002ADE227F|nr:uncharacterized protein LOC133518456 [Cydia pomonella]